MFCAWMKNNLIFLQSSSTVPDSNRICLCRSLQVLPLYRLYSIAGTDHFYTMSTAERDNASNKLIGYSQENPQVAGYIFPFLTTAQPLACLK
jgi:hypothetical protein